MNFSFVKLKSRPAGAFRGFYTTLQVIARWSFDNPGTHQAVYNLPLLSWNGSFDSEEQEVERTLQSFRPSHLRGRFPAHRLFAISTFVVSE